MPLQPLEILTYFVIAFGAAYVALRLIARFRVPVKGARPIEWLTILAKPPDGSYYPITGEWYDATDVYIDRRALGQLFHTGQADVERQISALTKLEGRRYVPKDDNAAQILDFLRPRYIAASRMSFDLRLIVGRSLSGKKHFLIQYGNMADLGTLARWSRHLSPEFILEILGLRSRGLVEAQLEDVRPDYVAKLQRLATNPIKGEWHWMYPLPKNAMTNVQVPTPSPLALEAIIGNQKIAHLIDMQPTIERHYRHELKRRQKLEGTVSDLLMAKQEAEEADYDLGEDKPRKSTESMLLLIIVGMVAGMLVGWQVMGITGAMAGGIVCAIIAALAGPRLISGETRIGRVTNR